MLPTDSRHSRAAELDVNWVEYCSEHALQHPAPHLCLRPDGGPGVVSQRHPGRHRQGVECAESAEPVRDSRHDEYNPQRDSTAGLSYSNRYDVPLSSMLHICFILLAGNVSWPI